MKIDMRKWFNVKAKKTASIKATERAKRRWDKDRAERTRLALLEPRCEWKITERVVRIIGETRALEVTIYAHDTQQDRRRKLRAIGL